MKKSLKQLDLKKLTIAKISRNELTRVQGGSSDPTDPDPNVGPFVTKEVETCTFSAQAGQSEGACH